jgi:hypothetical protein
MKRFLLPFLAAIAFMFTGCLENTQEITINEDGTGTINTTSDMSGLIPLAKQFGGDKMDDLPQEKIDTIISLANGADSIPDLTEKEKELMKAGTLRMNMDMGNEKMIFGMNFPFQNIQQISEINGLSNKVMMQAIKSQTGGGEAIGGQEMPQGSSMDDYFTVSFSAGILEKKLNKEKYAGVDGDEFLSGMKQTSAMGLVMKNTYIINLPRPAIKAEGKGLTISEDKKKITVAADINDFFDEPSKLEYHIEY